MKITALLLFCTFLASPVFADMYELDPSHGYAPVTSDIAQHFRRLGSDASCITKLHPWFAEITGKIKSQSGYQIFEQQAVSSLRPQESIVCTFIVDDEGKISDIKGSKHDSMKLIKDAGPFSPPPNSLPTTGGTVVEFYVKDSHLEIAMQPWFADGLGCIRITDM